MRINASWQAALSVNNVLDKRYYESIDPAMYAWYGTPRNLTLRIDARY
ncbi:MAG: hypothetical protein WDO56_19115 [Gammaproteobacteria bacterium]